jgi:hypothetical protein
VLHARTTEFMRRCSLLSFFLSPCRALRLALVTAVARGSPVLRHPFVHPLLLRSTSPRLSLSRLLCARPAGLCFKGTLS